MIDPTPEEALRLIVEAVDQDNLQWKLILRYGNEVTAGIFATVSRLLVEAAFND